MKSGGKHPRHGSRPLPQNEGAEQEQPSSTSRTSFAEKCYAFLLVASGFAISVGLVNVTKWVYVQHKFKYPIWLTGTHMLMSFVAAYVALFVFRIVPEEKRVVLTLKQQVFWIAPFSCAGAMSLGAANMALVYLYPSFHAMLQNSTPLWTVVCAVLLQKKRFNLAAYLALIPVCGGGAICAFNEGSDFALFGLGISLSAAAFRAVKAVLQAELLRGANLKLDSVSLLYYSSPFNMLLFFLWSFFQENGLEPYFTFAYSLSKEGQLWVLVAAVAAASFNLVGFLTIGYLGAVVAMVVGNMKTPTTILVSSLVFSNPVSWKQILGFAVGAFGVVLYDRFGKETTASGLEEEAASSSARTAGGMGGRASTSTGRSKSIEIEVTEYGRGGDERLEEIDLEFGMDDEDDGDDRPMVAAGNPLSSGGSPPNRGAVDNSNHMGLENKTLFSGTKTISQQTTSAE
eukprot:g5803.t1